MRLHSCSEETGLAQSAREFVTAVAIALVGPSSNRNYEKWRTIMYRHVCMLSLLFVSLSIPLAADSYDNGPAFGDSGGTPAIVGGLIVSDTFIFQRDVQVTQFEFSAWLSPEDRGPISSLELSITSSEFGGTTYFDQVLTSWSLGPAGCVGNEFGYFNCDEIATFAGPTLAGGTTYWVNLQNAQIPDGDPVYWDQNFGVGCGGSDGHGAGCPSLASQNMLGTIPSEAFTIYGSPAQTVPEPSSLLLLITAAMGARCVLGRK